VRSQRARRGAMMINAEHRDFKDLEEMVIQEKLKKLKRYAMDLNMIGYDVTIYSENGIAENDFELIIRKRPTSRKRNPS
jgi:phage FluMu gp28-like protein